MDQTSVKNIQDKKHGTHILFNSSAKPDISVLMPCFNSQNKAWITLESYLNMEDFELNWELIIADEHANTSEVILKYLNEIVGIKNCCKVTYIVIDPIKDGQFKNVFTLLEKWKLMASLATSDICALQADDDYSPEYRLINTFNNFKNPDCYFSTQPVGLFYNINNNEIFIYDGTKRKRYTHIRMMHLNMAYKTEYLKNIKITFLKSAVDQYLLRDIYEQICKAQDRKINLNKHIFYDDSDAWKYGFFTDGLNGISKNRIKLYRTDPGKTKKLIEYFDMSNGGRQYTDDKKVHHDATSILKVPWCMTGYDFVKHHYKFSDLGCYTNPNIMKLMLLEKYLINNELMEVDNFKQLFEKCYPVKEYYENLDDLKPVGIWALNTDKKRNNILNDNEIMMINVNDIDILVKNNRPKETLDQYSKILINNFYSQKVLFILDIHDYTFKGGYVEFKKKCMMYNIQYLCTRVKYSQEFFHLKSELYPYVNVFSIPHNINTSMFKDHQQEKIYDIIYYGSDYAKSYPFRRRIKNLLKTDKFQNKLKIRIVEWSEGIKGEALSKEINKGYISFSTKSIYNYLVKKYFEVPLSNTMLACDMPEYGKEFISKDNFIYIDENMSDDELLNIFLDNLKDKKELMERTARLRNEVYRIQSMKVIDMMKMEVNEERVELNNITFYKNICCVISTKYDFNILKLIRSYQTVITTEQIGTEIEKYLPSFVYINIADLNRAFRVSGFDKVMEHLNKHKFNMISIENDKVKVYKKY